jgi:hypothetical protein
MPRAAGLQAKICETYCLSESNKHGGPTLLEVHVKLTELRSIIRFVAFLLITDYCFLSIKQMLVE